MEEVDRSHTVTVLETFRVERPSRWLAVVVAVVALLAVAGLGAGLGRLVWAESRWAPLGDYPPQAVVNRVPGFPGPAAELDDDTVIEAEGVKCTNIEVTSKPVTIRGSVQWVSVEPPGSIVPTVVDVIGTREPGCSARLFRMAVPEAVALATRRLGAPMLWRVTGQEVPIRPDGGDGVPAVWVTENFLLISES